MNEMGAKSAYVRGLPGQGSVQAGTMVLCSSIIMSNSEVGFRLVLSFHHVISGDRVGVGSSFILWPSLPPRVSHSPAWPQTRWVVEEDDLELHILTCLYLLNAGITGVYRDMEPLMC